MRAHEFLPEKINDKIIEPGYSIRKQLPNGMIIQAEAMTPYHDDPDPYMRDLRGVVIKVFDPKADNWIHQRFGIAEVRFMARQNKDTGEWNLRPSGVLVNPDYQRQGIASAMYNFARQLGNDITPGLAQTRQGQAFWQQGGAGQGRDLELRDIPEPPPPEEKPAEPDRKPGFGSRLRRMFFPDKEMA